MFPSVFIYDNCRVNIGTNMEIKESENKIFKKYLGCMELRKSLTWSVATFRLVGSQPVTHSLIDSQLVGLELTAR